MSATDLPRGPMLFAHRGFSAEYPENTAVAFQAAIDLVIDGCECDVHLSSDGVPFLLHDDNLRRTTGVDRPASDLTWAELEQLDAGTSKDARFAGEKLPTLAQALAMHRGRACLVIEIKAHGDPATVAAATVEAITAGDALGWCTAISFGLSYLVEVKRRDARVPCLWLLGAIPETTAERLALLTEAVAAGLQGFSVLHTSLDAAFVRQAHRLGLAVWCWTVNDDDGARRAVEIGVDGICSDRPDWLRWFVGVLSA